MSKQNFYRLISLAIVIILLGTTVTFIVGWVSTGDVGQAIKLSLYFFHRY